MTHYQMGTVMLANPLETIRRLGLSPLPRVKIDVPSPRKLARDAARDVLDSAARAIRRRVRKEIDRWFRPLPRFGLPRLPLGY